MYPVKSTRLTVIIPLLLMGFCGLIGTAQAIGSATSSDETKLAEHNQPIEMSDQSQLPQETPIPTLATPDHTATIEPTTMIGEPVLPSNDPIESSTDQSTPTETVYPSATDDMAETDEPVLPGGH